MASGQGRRRTARRSSIARGNGERARHEIRDAIGREELHEADPSSVTLGLEMYELDAGTTRVFAQDRPGE